MPSDTTLLARINDKDDHDRFWIFPEYGLTYKLCATTTEAADAAGLTFPTASYPSKLFESPAGGTTKCTTVTPQYRTMHLQFRFGTSNSSTTNPEAIPMNYTLSYSVEE